MTGVLARPRLHGYWLREATAGSPVDPAPPLEGDAVADVVVVGGGYVGMWTAWFLLEQQPGIDVVLLERDLCGAGPSGRNGGFTSGWWDELDGMVERHGEEPALAACRALSRSIAAVGEWCDGHRVDAWFTRAGTVQVASSPAQEGAWRPAVEACRRLGAGEEYRELTPDEVAGVCRSPVFGGGAFMRDGATVQPARLALGLRRVLLERGVRIHEGTRVTSLDDGEPVVARSTRGTVRARRAVLGVNAWASAWPVLRRYIVVRGSYILLTAPVPDRLAELGWTGAESISDFRTALHYFRTTPDGRVAFGGVGRGSFGTRVGQRHDSDQGSYRVLRREMARLFPSLAGVPIEHAWGGPIDISGTHQPLFGTLGRGAHYAVGFTGNGVAPAHLAGQVMAAMAADRQDDLLSLPLVDHRPRPFPPEPLRSLGALLVQRAIVRKDRLEDQGRRADPLTRLVATMPRRLGYAVGPNA